MHITVSLVKKVHHFLWRLKQAGSEPLYSSVLLQMYGGKHDHLMHTHLHQQGVDVPQSIVHLKRPQSPSKQTVCLPTIWQKAMQQQDQHLQAEESLLPRCYETIKYSITERYSKYVLT